MRSAIPARRTAITSMMSCTTPETDTPQARACPTVGTYGESPSIAAIEMALNSNGAAAAAAKRFSPFSTPDNTAARQISSR